ncbi:MAG: glycosyltransferase [Bacteroidia bacterium]|nr:glycosyltransferase [Bacteroidia bacterium]
MKLSVIIVNYNVKYFLEQCLHSVMQARGSMEMECIVVDNNSVDGSCEMVEDKFPQVRLISNKENSGFSKANNQGIKISKSEYVLLLNPDTVVEEDTFSKVISFMDEHQDAGALGVHMIDGKGNFLPESKRGLPTPAVAFYKVFGLSALFPKSRIFGKYHLGFLNKNEIHEVDILSGAFMLLRRKALDKTGLLDETYFMYGEDIDLSYRIQKSGYKNYYFPKARIIHYKGESTKKSSVNYVLVFYRAMMIFAKKHFSPKNAKTFSFLINIAIYIRAGIALVSRAVNSSLLPVLDATLIYFGMYFLTGYWEENVKELNYPPFFLFGILPAYVLVWMSGIYLSGGYDKPISIPKIIRGIFSGSIFILVVYALLSEEYRFSRALILIGTLWASLAVTIIRVTLSLLRVKGTELINQHKKNLAIVASPEEGKRVLSLLQMAKSTTNFVGMVDPGNSEISGDEMSGLYLGKVEQLKEIIDVFSISEIVFSAKDLQAQMIIDTMLKSNRPDVDFKIAPPQSLYIIGSNSINDSGDLYFVDLNAINSPANKRNKRIVDVFSAVVMLIVSPILIFTVKNSIGLIINIFKVLFGQVSWVGLASLQDEGVLSEEQRIAQSLKKGILSPIDALKENDLDQGTISRLNILYAKEYNYQNDLQIIFKGYKNLGRQQVA